MPDFLHPVIYLEPYLLPPVTWWAQALRAERIVLHTGASYRRQTLFNRCFIKGPNRVQRLTVHVVGGRKRQPLPAVQLSYKEAWPRVFAGALTTAYRASPFYDAFVPDILAHLAEPPATLLALTQPLLLLLADGLGVKSRVEEYPGPEAPPGLVVLHDRAHPQGLQPAAYYQPFGGFEPGLSALDLLCNVGPAAPAVLAQMHAGIDWQDRG